MDQPSNIYQNIIKLVAKTVDYIFTKNGVPPEKRTAEAVASLTNTLLSKFEYGQLVTGPDAESVMELKILSD